MGEESTEGFILEQGSSEGIAASLVEIRRLAQLHSIDPIRLRMIVGLSEEIPSESEPGAKEAAEAIRQKATENKLRVHEHLLLTSLWQVRQEINQGEGAGWLSVEEANELREEVASLKEGRYQTIRKQLRRAQKYAQSEKIDKGRFEQIVQLAERVPELEEMAAKEELTKIKGTIKKFGLREPEEQTLLNILVLWKKIKNNLKDGQITLEEAAKLCRAVGFSQEKLRAMLMDLEGARVGQTMARELEKERPKIRF